MKKREFGRTGIEVPVIGQGTWNLERDFRAEAVTALRRGLDAGMAHVDTAEMYGGGRVEELVGEALAGRRAEVFLVSKVLPSNASFEGTLAACERSLKRLRTDHLDLYLLHWPSDEHPLEQTLAALEKLVEQGKTRLWGLSNFDAGELEAALRLAGPGRIACNQVLYNLDHRYAEAALLPMCQTNGIALVGYSPFGSGDFPSPRGAGGRVLAGIAGRLGASPRAVALAFLTRLPGTFTIPKAASVGHALENARAGSLQLSAEDVGALEAAFAGGTDASLPVI
ncbi:MAG TPA: aldo/keto reductase [Myxococcales bacterium]|jgi:diketogulonate reductase-like aldo/keto reductase